MSNKHRLVNYLGPVVTVTDSLHFNDGKEDCINYNIKLNDLIFV